MIISASRRTDIPAFYGDWFIRRLQEKYVLVRNPFNYHQVSKIILTPETVDFIVFWTKNPEKFLTCLHKINKFGYPYYFLFTLNPYEIPLEANVPKVKELVISFKKLSDCIGPDKIIWRYDPIIINHQYTISYHINEFTKLCRLLHGYSNKCITSYITMYKKCTKNLKNFSLQNIAKHKKAELMHQMATIARSYQISLTACTNENELYNYNIPPAKCIDDQLISKILNRQTKIKKDKNQRKNCHCAESVDIGAYNSCLHKCWYCYANQDFSTVDSNVKKRNPDSALLVGELHENDKISVRKMKSII